MNINVFELLTYFIIYILEKNNKIENSRAKLLIIPIILLSSTYFIFNNIFFNKINIFAIPILIIIMILELFNEKNIIVSRILEMFFYPLNFIGENLANLREVIENKLKINIDNRNEQKIKKIIKAIFITIPIVLVIIGLLSSADDNFKNIFTGLLRNIFNIICKIKISTILIKIILIICVFIYLLCFFEYIINRYEKDNELQEKNIKKDNVTIKMVLGTLNIVYLLFCIIQVESLFLINDNINYSEYARQGFFQLMIVSIINLVTILIAKKTKNNKYINIMSLIMIVFTFIILISSAIRMYMYESIYGYTLLRLLVYCALLTEAIMLIPTIMYVMDRKINLMKVYISIIITIYVGMNFANFDNMIAKRNVDRYINTGKIDIEYLKHNIGTDGVKQITRILNTNHEDNIKIETMKYLRGFKVELEEKKYDFRTLNISELKAKKILQ